MEKWNKYSFVCNGDCDALIEYTFKDGFGWPNGVISLTCPCGSNTTLMSVQDATILPTTTKEEKMEYTNMLTTTDTYNPNLLVTYKKIENGETSYATDKVVDIEYALDQSRRNYKNLTDKQNAWYTKEQALRSLLDETYADSQDQETLAQIADIFDVPLTKEIEVTAWVRVDLTVDVDMRDGDYDFESLVIDNLNVDSYASEVQITNFEIDRVEEGAY